jgi:hypothetical protein
MIVMGFCIVMEWLPVWFFGIVAFGIAFNVASKLRRYIS